MSQIFYSTFNSSTFTDWDDPHFYPYGSSINHVARRGVNYGYAFTCSDGFIGKMLSSSAATPLTTLNCRFPVQFYTDNALAGVTLPKDLVEFTEPVNADGSGGYYSESFNALIDYYADGHIRLRIQRGASATGTYTSSAGVITFDGSTHTFQCRFNFNSNTSCTFDIAVDGTSVISNTVTAAGAIAWTYAVGQPKNAGISEVAIYGTSQSYGAHEHLQTSFGEFRVDNTYASQSYPIPFMTPLTGTLCPTAASYTTGSGLYILTPGKTDDTVYDGNQSPVIGINRKIPDPEIVTALFGDED